MSLLRGLFVKASSVADLNVNYSEGLAQFSNSIKYIPAGLILTTVAATAGKSISGSSPATTATGLSFSVNIDGDGAQAISVSDGGTHTGAAVAAAIQTAIRALTANSAGHQASINAVTCVYTTVYTITSGSTGSGSSVVVTGAGASTLKLGVANGGTETVGLDTVVNSGKETIGILQIDSTGTTSIKWGTQVALGSGLAQYPSPDAGNLTLAKLFTAASPLTTSTSAIANSNINNEVLSAEFGDR